MRNVQDCTERLAVLVNLLRKTNLEIRAEISHTDAKPGSDEARLLIHFSGRDTQLLTENSGQLLDAIETLAVEMLGLSGAESESVRFDAGDYLSEQASRMKQVATTAIGQVRSTGTPHVFPPMRSRDLRLLEKALLSADMYFETVGAQSSRRVVLFPKDVLPVVAGAVLQHTSQ